LIGDYENRTINSLNRRWSTKYIDLLDPEVQKYLTLRLEASPSILRVYGNDIKEGNDNSSYSKFSPLVKSVEVESC